MIFDHDSLARYACRFTEKYHRVVGMMEDIYKHDPIKACVFVRNNFAVERFHRNVSTLSDQNIQTAELDVGTLFTNQVGNQTVATTDVLTQRTCRE